jgi:hypothetical protein
VENFNSAVRSNERLPVGDRLAQSQQGNDSPSHEAPGQAPPGLRAIEAMRSPQPPENSLSEKERKVVDKIVRHVRTAEQADRQGDNSKSDQAHLDLAMDLSCMNSEDLEKMLPTINKAIEKDHVRMAQDGDQVWVGENRDGGPYYLSYFAARQVNCGIV